MSDPGTDYDALPYAELKDRAFRRAERRADVRFFYDLFAHAPAAGLMADEGGSLGETSGSLIETVRAAREVFSGDPGDMEPMYRAVFIDYLTTHGG